jgi:sulfate adenylyltransferase subunit 2
LPLSRQLAELEAEAIYILRETAAGFTKPVLLYSIGKDSSVLLHLARKAFFPSIPPFRFLHVDTTWKFRDMINFRDETAARFKLDLIVHINKKGTARGLKPYGSNSSEYTRDENRSFATGSRSIRF